MQIRHIVIASDLSPAARLAYPHAAAFARAFGARVTLLHIDEISSSVGRASAALAEFLGTAAKARARRLEQVARDFANLETDYRLDIVPGSARAAIGSYIRSQHADLVVMAKRSGVGAQRFLLGTTAGFVLRTGDVPLLLIDPDDAVAQVEPLQAPCYKRILAPTDLGETSRRGVLAATELAVRFGAHVTMVHGLTRKPLMSFARGEKPLMAPLASLSDHQEAFEAELELLIRAGGDSRLDGQTVVGETPSEALMEAAMSTEADLIVMPATGKGFLQRMLVGSTTERLVKRTQRPVLVLPRSTLA